MIGKLVVVAALTAVAIAAVERGHVGAAIFLGLVAGFVALFVDINVTVTTEGD